MRVSAPPPARIAFSGFELDPTSGELHRNGQKVALPPRAFEVLRALAERPGEVVTREELRAKLWASDTFVEFDDSLNHAVNKLRQVLGDSAENPQFIETLPRYGYRFIAPVEILSSNHTLRGSGEAETVVVPQPPPSETGRPAGSGEAVETAAAPPAKITAANTVATVPRKGYRFVGSVQEEPEKRKEHKEPEAARVHIAEPAISKERRSRLLVRVLPVVVVLVLAIAVTGYLHMRRPPLNSVAVLPFESSSGDSNLEFISDGITEEAINNLTQVPALKVIARPTAFTYKGRHFTPQEVGKELGVAAVVLGRVVQRNNEFIVQVDIVNTSDGSELWGGQFKRPMTEIQSLQSDIVLQVTDKLRYKLTGEQEKRLSKRQTESADAYKLYLQGRNCISQADMTAECLNFFQQAVHIDPAYAQAWAGLADAYAYLEFDQLEPPSRAISKAREAALKALQIDDTVSEAHSSLGIIKFCYDWDAPGAEAEFRRAMELNPGEVFGRHWHVHYLEAIGELAKANAEMQKIVELDPLSKMYVSDLALEFYYMRQPEKVIRLAKTWTRPESIGQEGWITLAHAYELLGRRADALEIAERGLAGDDSSYVKGFGGAILARQGKRAKAEKLLAELKQRSVTSYVPAISLALLCLALDESDQGFHYLELAFEDRALEVVMVLPLDPQLDHLRSDPRYTRLLRQYSLPLKP